MPHDAAPDHDRVRLTPDELTTLAELERDLAGPSTGWSGARLVGAATAWRRGGSGRWLPWAVVLAAVATLVAVTHSPALGAVAATVTTLLTAWWCVRSGPGFYRRLASR